MNTRAAANGQLYSGATSVDMARKISGLASQNLGNYRSSLMSLAGQGQSAAGASAGYAGQMGQAQANSALARGETNAQMAGAVGGALSNLGGALSTKFAPASTTTGTGTNFGQFAPNQTGNWSGASSSLLPSQNYYGFRSYF
ncbi:hypothetical protein [Pseudoxanthomonas sp.]|uniref:hypothetical protein n=1 Tax=Pseudoxanthomonas sp. TaxID=1871049 RepID=UPI002638C2B6|nr:hypothetical protein [Pseudoxanthomonas sp.]WDS36242.1 MAG: hypothetical protein O8I58_18555 [Pseudoxanthomonas sp.]